MRILEYLIMINKGDKFSEIYNDVQNCFYDRSIHNYYLKNPKSVGINMRNTLYQSYNEKRITNFNSLAYNMWLIQKNKVITLEKSSMYYLYYASDIISNLFMMCRKCKN